MGGECSWHGAESLRQAGNSSMGEAGGARRVNDARFSVSQTSKKECYVLVCTVYNRSNSCLPRDSHSFSL